MEVDRIIGGKYRLRRGIGEGAMGSVWAADHELHTNEHARARDSMRAEAMAISGLGRSRARDWLLVGGALAALALTALLFMSH